eukprot:TRINITY_DN4620_c0_g1_i7.p1 TRINITY_DN4620_c0_g1~~TRINITY_DN4620_c0_g1_i7.p1  ORF type:complete len:199 (-),score=51.63 TRINITY_DN4620_c0_g1_i7:19-564(-)
MNNVVSNQQYQMRNLAEQNKRELKKREKEIKRLEEEKNKKAEENEVSKNEPHVHLKYQKDHAAAQIPPDLKSNYDGDSIATDDARTINTEQYNYNQRLLAAENPSEYDILSHAEQIPHKIRDEKEFDIYKRKDTLKHIAKIHNKNFDEDDSQYFDEDNASTMATMPNDDDDVRLWIVNSSR